MASTSRRPRVVHGVAHRDHSVAHSAVHGVVLGVVHRDHSVDHSVDLGIVHGADHSIAHSAVPGVDLGIVHGYRSIVHGDLSVGPIEQVDRMLQIVRLLHRLRRQATVLADVLAQQLLKPRRLGAQRLG
ncbi:hypothetical protein ABEV74_06235 [Paenibacillus cisolokensis]|uniref:hypothetical protein n=1 Tax=Paenibacillus cisolokensis TaxID=1658519 RepID=UPI003D2CA3A1